MLSEDFHLIKIDKPLDVSKTTASGGRGRAATLIIIADRLFRPFRPFRPFRTIQKTILNHNTKSLDENTKYIQIH